MLRHVCFLGMPRGFFVGVHAETDPDIFGVEFGLFAGKAFRDAEVAVGHERMYLVRGEVFECFVLEEGIHDGGGGLAIDDSGRAEGAHERARLQVRRLLTTRCNAYLATSSYIAIL